MNAPGDGGGPMAFLQDLQAWWRNPWGKTLLIAITVAVVSWALRETAVITQPLLGAVQTALVPLAIGFTVAYVLTPLVDGMQRAGLKRLFATSLLYMGLSGALFLVLGIGMPAMVRQSSELFTRFFQDIHYYDENDNQRFDKGEPILLRVSDPTGEIFLHDRNRDGSWQAGEPRFVPGDARVRAEESLLHQGMAWARDTRWRFDALIEREPEARPLRFLAFYLDYTATTRSALVLGLEQAESWEPGLSWNLPSTEETRGKPWNGDWPGPSAERVAAAAEGLPEELRIAWLARMVHHGQTLKQQHQDVLVAWNEIRSGVDSTGTQVEERLRRRLSEPLSEERRQEALQYLQQLRGAEAGAEYELLRAVYFDPSEEDSTPLQEMLDAVRQQVSGKLAELPQMAGMSAAAALGNMGTILQFGLDVILVPIYAFFLTLGMPQLRSVGRRYVPIPGRARTIRLTHEVERIVAAFFRGRLIVCLLCALLVSIGFLLLDVPYAILFGMLIGLATAIPLSGLLFLVPVVLLVLAEGGDGLLWRASLVVAVYTVVQTLEATVFTPWIMGREVQLHPVLLLVALVFFGHLMGVLGLLLAVPIAATLRILLREFLLPRVRAVAGVPETSLIRRPIDKEPPDDTPQA